MNGLDKIIAQILDDAKQESLAIQEKAAGEAETTLAAAGEKVKKLEEEQAKSAAQREKSYEERLRSSAALKKRQAILAAKQAIIEEALTVQYGGSMNPKNAAELLAKPDEAYFAWMEQLLSRFVTDRAGEIYVSKRDLERMPDDFPAKIEKTAQEKGGSLVLKKEPREIDGGFVLVYGGVEENCSAGALFASQRDELADKVHAMLFG